ncbi:tryptophan synthase subunit alpha, partial [Staphylococcus saprophyticus]|uniref:tryptophan synthase subunit alpha n=1 Tax=Staphylococcus saprophyticus TaxID=29385 RepID=UPI0021B30FC5
MYTLTINPTTRQHGKFHPHLKNTIKHIKPHTQLPVLPPFPITTPPHLKHIIQPSDPVVIGTEIVKR